MAQAKSIQEVAAKIEEHQVTKRTTVYRARALEIYIGLAIAGFMLLLLLVKFGPTYFSIDLLVTQTIQEITNPTFSAVMFLASQPGYEPYQSISVAIVVVTLFLLRFRLESLTLLSSTILSSVVVAVLKSYVDRPRPSIDLVHVLRHLSEPSFPSGHVVSYTVFFGFLAFFLLTSFKKSWWRNVLTGICIVMIVLVGPSRVYLGAHWVSDVLGAYLLGSLLLLGTIRIYHLLKGRISG